MIVDIHAHVFGARNWVPETFWQSYRSILASNLGKSVKAVESEVVPSLFDADGAALVREMDAAGVDRAAVLCLEWGLMSEDRGTPPVEQLHEAYAAVVARHSDRLLFGVGVDPRRREAPDLLQRAITRLGARLLKLYPPIGFYPNDEAVYPLYRICDREGIPVLFHVGPAVRPFRSKYSHPLHLDDVATDFQDLSLVMGHSGHGWWRDALALARSKHNLWLDVSGWGLLAAHPMRVLEPLRELMDVVPGRVLFGSDYIGLPGAMKRFVELIRERPPGAPQFSDDELSAFFSGSAAGLLGL